MNSSIQSESLVTLHYRIELANGQPLISTFDGNPATLQLGAGEMQPRLEGLLVGLENGTEKSFELAPGEAFGDYREDLIERVRRADLPESEAGIEPMSFMEFFAPDGSRYSGLVTEVDDEAVTIDFNHPLAGKDIRFDVRVIGVL